LSIMTAWKRFTKTAAARRNLVRGLRTFRDMPAPRSQVILRRRPRSSCFDPCFGAGRMFIRADSRVERPGSRATRLPAPMNGFAACAKSRESNARIVQIAGYCRSPTR
jgi:hypothetical protein